MRLSRIEECSGEDSAERSLLTMIKNLPKISPRAEKRPSKQKFKKSSRTQRRRRMASNEETEQQQSSVAVVASKKRLSRPSKPSNEEIEHQQSSVAVVATGSDISSLGVAVKSEPSASIKAEVQEVIRNPTHMKAEKPDPEDAICWVMRKREQSSEYYKRLKESEDWETVRKRKQARRVEITRLKRAHGVAWKSFDVGRHLNGKVGRKLPDVATVDADVEEGFGDAQPACISF